MLDALNAIYAWMTHGIYDLITSAYSSLVEWLVLTYLQTLLWAIGFAWDIAQGIISDLQISNHLNASWGNLPASAQNTLTFFRIPEVILNLIAAFITRFVLKFVPTL